MTSKSRGELITPKDSVALVATFRDQFGSPHDTDSYPQISITDPSGLLVLAPTSQGVQKIDTGKYQYDFDVGFAPSIGVWMDNWVGYINGFRIEASFNFIVSTTDLPQLNSDGYYHLGDEVPFDFTQTEIFNINKLLKTLRSRLNSRGKVKTKDQHGNVIYVSCDIYSTEMLITLLANSLTLFNEVPHFTFFTFADTDFLNQFHDVVVEGAVINAMASQALLERGGEVNVSDSGVQWTVPTISELLNTQSSTLLSHHYEKLKFIKNSLKPYPLGLGSYGLNGSHNASFRRLRLLRQRQII